MVEKSKVLRQDLDKIDAEANRRSAAATAR